MSDSTFSALQFLIALVAALGDETEPNRKKFRVLRNKARNEMKHYTSGKVFSGNLNREAYFLLESAIKNWRALNIESDIKFRMKIKQIQKAFVERNSS